MPMGRYMSEDFLLESDSAQRLYHDYVEALPIVDYHCHLPPEQIAKDQRWENLSQVWLYGDHYKWRLMRANGVPERFCTGHADDWEKFEKWAGTLPYALRNPLYDWTHLELKRYFGIADKFLGPATARAIWNECNQQIGRPEFSARRLMKRSGVVLVCTTDDPADSLEHHRFLQEAPAWGVRVLPTWRPDRGMAVDSVETFNLWVNRLGAAADTDIRDLSTFMEALRRRHEFFHRMGCRLSDHGLETVPAEPCTEREFRSLFRSLRGGRALGADDAIRFKSAMLYEFCAMDAEKGWTQQFHLGALRNTNSGAFVRLGPDAGYDSMGDRNLARPLARLFDRLESAGRLAKTIVYNLNPKDGDALATLIGCFHDEATPGKMQYGSAWWFLDQKDGMERQIDGLSRLGLLGRFVGMVTDSRSFLSYTRHEYFRRILCNRLGDDMERGLMPDDVELVGEMARDICHRNAVRYFGFNPGE